MVILDIEQGSSEWFKARLGVPTASMFKKIVTSTGKPSKQALDYAYLLAGESICGEVESTHTNYHMERGKELEPEARQLYEFLNDVEVREVGLCYKDKSRSISCSPDGLVGDHGGLEIKCPALATHTKYLHGGKCPTDYVPQVQGSLYVTGLKWWDFMSYYPGMPEFIVRCYPDQKIQEAIDTLLKKFLDTVEKIKSELQAE